MVDGPVTIPLTQGRVALVDAADAEWLRQSTWGFTHGYARRCRRADGRYHWEYMHRVIVGAVTGDGVDVDHINGDRLDNRRANLHPGSHQTNLDNRRGANRNSSTEVRGVRWDKRRGAYFVVRSTRGRQAWAGYFDTLAEAAAAAAVIYREMPMS